jgi:hypothetical protein
MTATVNLKKGALRVWLVATIFWLSFAALGTYEAVSYWAGYHWSLFSRNATIGAALEEKSRTKNLILACRRARELQCKTSPPRRTRETGRLIEEGNPVWLAQAAQAAAVAAQQPEAPPAALEVPPPVIEGDNPYLKFFAEKYRQEEVCLNSPQFLATLIAEAEYLGEPRAFLIESGATCASYYAMRTPPDIYWFGVIVVLLVPVLPILVYLLGFWLYRGFVT